MLIPVFVSAPTSLSDEQEVVRRLILSELGQHGIEDRSIGRTDYPTTFPLREVLTLAKHCSGGVILGFSQFEATTGIWKKGTPQESVTTENKPILFPTPWNNLEAGILFSLHVPMLVFREAGIQGGVFDNGVTDLFVHPMPELGEEHQEHQKMKAMRAVFQKWTAEVRAHYYGES